MSAPYPRLLGDIGGTHARWAWQADAGAPPGDVKVLRCADSATIAESALGYLSSGGHGRPAAAGIGIATPVTGDLVRMTNHHWSFSVEALRNALGAERCLVINDFTALAMSLSALGAGDTRAVGGGQAVPGAPVALLGPGTGLGVSGLLQTAAAGAGARLIALSGEGGHVSLAASDDEQAALLAVLRRRFGHVSAERVLSGPGLVNLYEALCELDGAAGMPVPAPTPDAATITLSAHAGTDARARRVVHHFTAFLGNVAGNLALTLGALGGVYIGGGIVPRLGSTFDDALFRRHFESKGRFDAYLAKVPVQIITAATPALLGATRALDAD